MSLFFAELRKVWGGRVFPALLAILAAANLLLLWMGTRPTAKQPPASAYRAVGTELSDKTMEEKGTYLHSKYTEIESLVKIGQYYRELAYGGYGLTQYRQDNAAMFDPIISILILITRIHRFLSLPMVPVDQRLQNIIASGLPMMIAMRMILTLVCTK